MKGLVLVSANRTGAVTQIQSIRTTVMASWSQIKNQINSLSDRVSYRSGPYFCWEAFAAKDKYGALDPSRTYVKIIVGLTVDLPDPLTTCKASVSYWLDLAC